MYYLLETAAVMVHVYISMVVDGQPPLVEVLLELVAVAEHHWNDLCITHNSNHGN